MTAILPENEYSGSLRNRIAPYLPPDVIWYNPVSGLPSLQGRRLLFVVALDAGGCNPCYYQLLSQMRQNTKVLEGCIGAIIMAGVGELYTKAVAQELALAANMAGCAFIGRPLVERTGSLRNFRLQAQAGGTDEETAFSLAVTDLAQRLAVWTPLPPPRHILALHASERATSNTLTLWDMVKQALPAKVETEEFCLRNGSIIDCRGCAYTTCLHFGEQGRCFYGGPLVEQVFPALLRADTLIMLCANYNDALSANLTAFVNRLTALYRQNSFSGKRLYALVVSGYSGGDCLGRQLISGLAMNKSFFLPPHFCLFETACEQGAVRNIPGMEDKVRRFVAGMSN